MTLEELYEQIGGDYTEALNRLRMEKLIAKFIVRFLDDTTCSEIVTSWAEGDEEGAFHAAHSAKGVCMNLALTKLGSLAADITEALRPGNDELRAKTDVDALVAQLDDLYKITVEGINAYMASN